MEFLSTLLGLRKALSSDAIQMTLKIHEPSRLIGVGSQGHVHLHLFLSHSAFSFSAGSLMYAIAPLFPY